LTAKICVVEPVFVPPWSLFATVNVPQDAATQDTELQTDVVLPNSPSHVAVPDPLYPSLHWTGWVTPVLPEIAPLWLLFATIKTPHEEARQN